MTKCSIVTQGGKMVVQSVEFLESKVSAKLHPIQEIALALSVAKQRETEERQAEIHDALQYVRCERRNAKFSRRQDRLTRRNEKMAWLNS